MSDSAKICPTSIFCIIVVIVLIGIIIWIFIERQQPPRRPVEMKFGTTLVSPDISGIPTGTSPFQVPDYDIRDAHFGLITHALDQRACESCWAFAITTAVSDAIRIKYNTGTSQEAQSYLMESIEYAEAGTTTGFVRTLNNISPHYFASCSLSVDGKGGDADCSQTNDLETAFSAVMVPGKYVSAKCRLNTPSFGKYVCNDPSETAGCIKYSIESYTPIPTMAKQNATSLQQEIQESIKRGIPVVSGMDVYPSFNTYWLTGRPLVYPGRTGNEERQGGHAVTIMGWGTDSNLGDYWIVRNSWGETHGLLGKFQPVPTGYFRVARGVDAINIESNAYTFSLGPSSVVIPVSDSATRTNSTTD